MTAFACEFVCGALLWLSLQLKLEFVYSRKGQNSAQKEKICEKTQGQVSNGMR